MEKGSCNVERAQETGQDCLVPNDRQGPNNAGLTGQPKEQGCSILLSVAVMNMRAKSNLWREEIISSYSFIVSCEGKLEQEFKVGAWTQRPCGSAAYWHAPMLLSLPSCTNQDHQLRGTPTWTGPSVSIINQEKMPHQLAFRESGRDNLFQSKVHLSRRLAFVSTWQQ